MIRSIHESYRDMNKLEEKENFLRSTAILCPTNSKADTINESLINSDILGDTFAFQEVVPRDGTTMCRWLVKS